VSAASIRRAEPDDLPAVAAIYAQYVERTVVTFETAVPDAAAWRRRFDEVVARGLPFLVAVEAGRLVGYAYAGPWKERAAYRHTVESTIYLAPGATGRGTGSALLDALLAACAEAGMRQVIAVIADTGDPASSRLHTRCGFREVGRLERVGFKHDRWVDTALMQRELPGTAQVAGTSEDGRRRVQPAGDDRGMRSHLAPVLRVVDATAAADWYARHLGFAIEFEHRFEPGLPLYVGLVRGDARIHLSEHTGDARPGTLVYLWVSDVDAVAAACGIAEIDDNPWGRDVEVTDPDGNRIRVGTPRTRPQDGVGGDG
jgi:L-amino acid N-acyltransferase YncA/catechol 2,3-dioxygenase-like lactoylglutathione lyase family enzyme